MTGDTEQQAPERGTLETDAREAKWRAGHGYSAAEMFAAERDLERRLRAAEEARAEAVKWIDGQALLIAPLREQLAAAQAEIERLKLFLSNTERVEHLLATAEIGAVKQENAKLRAGHFDKVVTECVDDLAKAEAEVERGYQMLSAHGVPKARARYLGNGIDVLATRFGKEIAALKQRLEAELTDADLCILRDYIGTLLGCENDSGWQVRGFQWAKQIAKRAAALVAEPPVRKCICEVPPQGLPRMADPDCPLHGDPAIIGEPPGGQQEQGHG